MVYYSSAVFKAVGIASDVAASALVGAANVLGEMELFVPRLIAFHVVRRPVQFRLCACVGQELLLHPR